MNCNVSSQFFQIKNIYHFNLLIFILTKRHNTYLYAIITIIIVYKYKYILDHVLQNYYDLSNILFIK